MISRIIINITISLIVIGLKILLFFTNSLAKLLSDICSWTVCYRTVQKANHIQSCSLNQPITFKVVVKCVRACALAFVFLRLITSRKHGCLIMFNNVNFPFLS